MGKVDGYFARPSVDITDFYMDPIARQVCIYNSGGGALMAGCAAQMVMRTLRGYFQPDTFGHIFTQMDRFTSYARTDQLMFPSGGGFEDLFIRFQCIKAARLKPNEKTLLMARLGGVVD